MEVKRTTTLSLTTGKDLPLTYSLLQAKTLVETGTAIVKLTGLCILNCSRKDY